MSFYFHFESISYFVFILDCLMKVGKTLSFGTGRLDDGKALADLGFEVKNSSSSSSCIFTWLFQILLLTLFVNMQIGDYLDVSIIV